MIPKIERGEYIDLHKLLPKEKIFYDEGKVQLVNKEGNTFFQNQTEKETPQITNLKRWEQAFKVYATIYVKANPDKAAKLFEYINVIRNAASVCIWGNMYVYDCTFRRVIAKYHPFRKRSGILHQGWSLFLKTKIEKGNSGQSQNLKRKRKEPCWRFNKGRCSYGNSCKFEHKCAICNKTDHGSSNCQKKEKEK